MSKFYVSQFSSLSVQISPPVTEFINGAKVTRDPGRIIRFTNGRYESTSDDEIALIEKSSSFNTDFFDLEAQKNKGKTILDKVDAKAVEVVSGPRTTDKQFKGGNGPTHPMTEDQGKSQEIPKEIAKTIKTGKSRGKGKK